MGENNNERERDGEAQDEPKLCDIGVLKSIVGDARFRFNRWSLRAGCLRRILFEILLIDRKYYTTTISQMLTNVCSLCSKTAVETRNRTNSRLSRHGRSFSFRDEGRRDHKILHSRRNIRMALWYNYTWRFIICASLQHITPSCIAMILVFFKLCANASRMIYIYSLEMN